MRYKAAQRRRSSEYIGEIGDCICQYEAMPSHKTKNRGGDFGIRYRDHDVDLSTNALTNFLSIYVTGVFRMSVPASEITGQVAVANGGTGQATSAAGFDALAPTTARGDLIVRGMSGNTRLPGSGFGLAVLGTNGVDPTWVAYTALGAGGVTRSYDSKLRDVLKTPFDYGCAADGVIDDTANFQRALNAAGGGILYLPQVTPSGTQAIYRIGNVTIPDFTSIVGSIPHSDIVSNRGGINVFANPYTLNGIIRPVAGTTITLGQGTSVRDCLVVHENLSLPATTDAQATILLSQFADIAFTANSVSFSVENVGIYGFTRAIYSPASQRVYVRHVIGDCTNGITVYGSGDVCHISQCHFWPFLTACVSGVSATNLARGGTSYDFGLLDDWTTVMDCFSFGYAYAYASIDASNIAFIRCQADGPSTSLDQQAFRIVQTGLNLQRYTVIDNCFAPSHATGVFYDSTGSPLGQNTIRINNSFFAGLVGLDLVAGAAIIEGNEFQGETTGINIQSGFGAANIIGNQFVNVAAPISINNNATLNRIRDNQGYNPIGPDAPTVGASPWTYVAGASPETHYIWAGVVSTLSVSGRGIFYNAAGTTVHLEPGESYVVIYTAAPTVVRMQH